MRPHKSIFFFNNLRERRKSDLKIRPETRWIDVISSPHDHDPKEQIMLCSYLHDGREKQRPELLSHKRLIPGDVYARVNAVSSFIFL